MKIDFITMSVRLATYAAFFAPMAVLLIAMAFDRRRRKRIEKPPQTEKLLRPSGYSLSIRLDETWDKSLFSMLLACASSAFALASFVTTVQLLAAHASILRLTPAVVLLVGFSVTSIWATRRAFRLYQEAWNIRLGLSGEQAVAGVLHEVGDCGFRAFHDLPGDGDWNIDHVAAGTRGVFLIETKARNRRPSRNGQQEHEVIYDGKTLQFPSGSDAGAVPQAERNARWLSGYLAKKTGEKVEVQALVVLPGWYVQQAKGSFNVKVMNTTFLAGFLRRENEKLEAAQVRRILNALDEKCRDVEF